VAALTITVSPLQGTVNPRATIEQAPSVGSTTPSKSANATLLACKIPNSAFRHTFAAVGSNSSEEGGHESYVVRFH
jgi:hypothetical protein